jgi:hypothetical protein
MSTLYTITTLPVQKEVVLETSLVKVPTPSVTVTSTVVKTTTVKSTRVVWTTSTKTAKGVGSCV